MILVNMRLGVLPYVDGTGYQFEVALNDGALSVSDGGNVLTMTRDECKAVMDAMDELWAAHDKIIKD